MLTKTTVLPRAGRWFLNSGIHDFSGGVARYYLSDSRQNARVSNEITGYTASTYAYMHAETGDPGYLAAADRAASYLCRDAWDALSCTFPFETPANGDPPLAYFFDCGIIVRGLLAAWRVTSKREYLDKAKEAGISMASDFAADVAVWPVIELPRKQPAVHEFRWSRQPGCYQLKSALAWLDLAAVSGESAGAGHYERILEYSLDTHCRFLPGDPDPANVMDRLHAYCYFLEALLPVAPLPECAAALALGIDTTARLLRQIAPAFARSDVYAQLLRVRIHADVLGAVDMDRAAASEEAAAAADFQSEDDKPRLSGGFYFGRKNGVLLPHVNPVSTSFCMQALHMWEQYGDGRRDFQIADLI